MKIPYLIISSAVAIQLSLSLNAQPVAQKPAAKTTATASRLIAEVSLTYTVTAFRPVDSTSLEYAPPRGQWLNGFEDWKFSSKLNYYYDPATLSYLTYGWYRQVLNYDAASLPTEQVVQNWNAASAAWVNATRFVYSYSATGKPSMILTYEWDAATGNWKTQAAYRNTYFYDGADRLTEKKTETWFDFSSSFRNSFRYIYAWYGTGNMSSRTLQYWDGTSAWDNQNREVYTWDASNNKTKAVIYAAVGSGWETGGRFTYSGFHNHQPDLTLEEGYVVIISGPLWYNVTRTHTMFNAYDQPVYSYEEKWDVTLASWYLDNSSKGRRWHYEDYDPTAPMQVLSSAVVPCRVTLFPVPAGNFLNIDLEWDEPQPYNICMTDAQGRVRSQWGMPAGKCYKEKMPIDLLSPGTYNITVTGKDQKIARSFVVVR